MFGEIRGIMQDITTTCCAILGTYCVATAWLLGIQDIEDFTDAAILRRDVRATAGRIEVFVDTQAPPGNGGYEQEVASWVEVIPGPISVQARVR